MGVDTPEQIRLGRGVLTQLRRLLIAAWPEEGCALLLAQAGLAEPTPARPIWTIVDLWPCRNAWQPAEQRRRRFAIDPREQLLAQRWARQRQLTLLGSAHSHPHGEARPSTTDLGLAFTPTLMLILAPRDGWRPRAWWLEGSDSGAVGCAAVPLRLES